MSGRVLGRMRVTTDSEAALNRILDELVDLGILEALSIRRRRIRALWVGYGRLTPEFS